MSIEAVWPELESLRGQKIMPLQGNKFENNHLITNGRCTEIGVITANKNNGDDDY